MTSRSSHYDALASSRHKGTKQFVDDVRVNESTRSEFSRLQARLAVEEADARVARTRYKLLQAQGATPMIIVREG
eukprot:15666231-Heterocapsa_arctica.AAC.1